MFKMLKKTDAATYKVSGAFKTKADAVVSLAAAVGLTLAVGLSLGFGLPQTVGAAKAFKEYRSVYEPTGEMVTVRKTPFTEAEYSQIAARLTTPGVTASVSRTGITVQTARIDVMQDHENWRAAVDRVMRQGGLAEWAVVELCYGTRCTGAAARVTLSASRLGFQVPVAPAQAAEGSPEASATAAAPTVPQLKP